MVAVKRWFEQWRDIIAIVFMVATVFFLKHQQGQIKQDAKASLVREIRIGQLRSCHRLNVLRAEDNRSHLQDYRVYVAVSAFPGIGTFKETVRAAAAGKEWVPLTQCYPATYHPLTYDAPEPIPFAKELPTESALVVGRGE
jgi:hypothetical protein